MNSSPTSRSRWTDPRFQRRLSELTRASDGTWLLALAIGLTFTLIAAYGFPSSPSGKFWAYAAIFLRGSLYLWSGDALRGRGGETLYALVKMGMVAGTFELLVDWVLIHGIDNGRLVYLTGNDVVLLGSPVWMPLAWACVVVELGYPSLRLFRFFQSRISLNLAAMVASLLTGTAALVTVGFYEYFAYRAGWWKYLPAHHMLGEFCAWFIPLGEFFMFLAVLTIAAQALAREKERNAPFLEAGAVFAAAIALGYAAAYLLLEWGRGPL